MGSAPKHSHACRQLSEIISGVPAGSLRKASVDIVFSLESTTFSGDTDARSTQDMTARPPVETQEASSEGSSDSLEAGDSQTSPDAQDAADPKLKGGAGETGAGKLNWCEPSMSRTLEAILSK